MSLDALFLTVDALKKVGAESYRVLLTVSPPRPSRDAEEAYELLKSQNIPLFAQVIQRRVAFQKASLGGVTVGEVTDPRAVLAWAEYEAVGNEIIKESEKKTK